ncbi:MAG: acyl-CoA dehydrogenase [Marinomonas sp.]
MQVHGGMGFVEETGAAQHMRDSRILPIYEGTNGIQAIDLVGRKLRVDGGESAKAFIAEMRETADTLRESNQSDFGAISARLTSALDDLETTTNYMLDCLSNKKMNDAMAGATPYQKLFALTASTAFHAKGALETGNADDGQASLRIKTARFFAENLATETASLRLSVLEGADGVLSATEELLAG